jgi:hypothetical protein
MAYCSVEDVQKLFANIVFGETTPVTTEDIETVHIPTADAVIDARLRRFTDVPVTSAGDLELMRLISMSLAAGTVAEILYETSSQPNDQPGSRRHRERGERLLAQIEAGTLTLDSARRSAFDAGVYASYAASVEDVKPLVRLERDF